jgi:hypothetical protein
LRRRLAPSRKPEKNSPSAVVVAEKDSHGGVSIRTPLQGVFHVHLESNIPDGHRCGVIRDGGGSGR